MKKYSLYSNKLNSDIVFKYGANGILIGYEIQEDREFTQVQLEEFIGNLPWNEQRLIGYCKSKKISLTEILPDLSFIAFWNRYNYKDGSSKKKTEAQWNKMPEGEKAKALAYVTKYEKFLFGKTISKKYATTYLSDQLWNN